MKENDGGWWAHLGLLALLEKCLLPDLLLRLLPREIPLLCHLLHHLLVDPLEIYLHGCGDDISGIDPSQGDAVYFEGASDEEDALGEVLEEDDALAAETAGEEDEDCPGDEGGAGAGGVDGFADLDWGEGCQREEFRGAGCICVVLCW